MKKNTFGLLIVGFALAGGCNQAVASQICGPVGGCNGGDRCQSSGLWAADKSCSIKASGPPVLVDKKARSQDIGSVKQDIFDRLGNSKTKANCETAGGVWAGEDGKSSCTGPRKTQSRK